MSFNWVEYLALASELVSAPPGRAVSEARLRSAISRAYYAAFCQARNHLRDKENLKPPEGPKVHRWVREQFEKSPKQSRRAISQSLDRLRDYRNQADYDDTMPGLAEATKAALLLAEQVAAGLNLLSGRTA